MFNGTDKLTFELVRVEADFLKRQHNSIQQTHLS